jgi:hypothetical protein
LEVNKKEEVEKQGVTKESSVVQEQEELVQEEDSDQLQQKEL